MNHKPPALLLLTLLLPFGWDSIGHAADATPAVSPLDKPIRLDLWGRHLGDAVSQITERSGVDVVIDPQFILPKRFREHRLYLEAERLPTRTAIEWLCRAIGSRYRVTGPRSVLITGSYRWMKEKPKLCMPRFSLDSLMAPGESAASFERKLWELVKPNALLGETYYLRIEVDGPNEREGTKQLVAVVPRTLKGYLEAGLEAMTKPGQSIGQAPAPVVRPAEADFVQRLRQPVVVRYKGWTVQQAIRDLALQSRLFVAFEHAPYLKTKLPTINLDLGEVSTRQAVEALADAMGFKGYESMAPDAVWLTVKPRRWTRATSRAFLWENLSLKSYAVGGLATALGGGEVLSHHIRRRVCADIWLDPATAVVYHRRGGLLLVLAPADVQDAVLRELIRLQRAWQREKGRADASPAALNLGAARP